MTTIATPCPRCRDQADEIARLKRLILLQADEIERLQEERNFNQVRAIESIDAAIAEALERR